MKCNYCGQENPEGSTRCEKCKKTITPSSDAHEEKREKSRMSESGLKKTISESEFLRMKEQGGEALHEEKTLCPECHLELDEDGTCPDCGKNYKNKNAQSTESKMKNNKNKETELWDFKADITKGRFFLTPLSGKTRMPEGDPMSFVGNEIELNRDNLAPDNSTITSKVQAVVEFENGKWAITDESELQSTFVQAARKVELQSGDLILLGNQLYRFDCLSE